MDDQSQQQPRDLGAMTREDLLHLQEQAEQEIQKRNAAEVEAFREQAREISERLGMSLTELLGVATEEKATRIALPAKYRDPISGDTWSGKGPSPKWIKDSGKPKENFLINHS